MYELASVAEFWPFNLKWQVNLLLSKWMRELEKIFYGNIVAYDSAIKPADFSNAIWR